MAIALNALSFALRLENDVAFRNSPARCQRAQEIAKALKVKSKCTSKNYEVYCATLRLIAGSECGATVGLSDDEKVAAFTKVVTSAKMRKHNQWGDDDQLLGHVVEQELFMLGRQIKKALEKDVEFSEEDENGEADETWVLNLPEHELRTRLQNLLLIDNGD